MRHLRTALISLTTGLLPGALACLVATTGATMTPASMVTGPHHGGTRPEAEFQRLMRTHACRETWRRSYGWPGSVVDAHGQGGAVWEDSHDALDQTWHHHNRRISIFGWCSQPFPYPKPKEGNHR